MKDFRLFLVMDRLYAVFMGVHAFTNPGEITRELFKKLHWENLSLKK